MVLWSLIFCHFDWITGCPDMLLQCEWHHPIHEGLHVTRRWRKGGCTALGLTAWDGTLISFCPQWSSFSGLQTQGVYTISSPAPRPSNYTSSFPGSPVCRSWNSLAAIISWINTNQQINQPMNQSYWFLLIMRILTNTATEFAPERAPSGKDFWNGKHLLGAIPRASKYSSLLKISLTILPSSWSPLVTIPLD